MKDLIIQDVKDVVLLQVMIRKLEIGLDEVGKGCIFGPIFSAVIALSKKNGSKLKILGLDDSKKLTRKKREQLIPYIFSLSEDWGIGQSSVREIDLYGIRYATELSMIRAVNKLKSIPGEILIDGSLPLRQWEGLQKQIIRGETHFASIAAASVVAKVFRDQLMIRLEDKYKGYLVYKNKGYGTKEHFSSINKFGLTNLHRKTFLKKLNII